MTVHAYVLVQTDVGRAIDVARRMAEIDGVVLAEDVTGPYDVIARVEAGSIDQLGQLVVSQVQLIEGITRTVTCPVVNL
jgi:DNA-binding Lrp family transcriptional regulator